MSDCQIKFEEFKTDKNEYKIKRHFDATIMISGKLETCRQNQPVNITVTTPKGKKALKGKHTKTGYFEIPFLLTYDKKDDPSGTYNAVGEYLNEEGTKIFSTEITFKVIQIEDE